MEKGALVDTLFLPKRRIGLVAKEVVLVSSFVILTALTSQIKIEIGIVPITMQTLTVLLSGALLGSRRGSLSQVLYLLGGLLGIPWFARGGGIQYILSPTFGYLVGFVFAAFFVGYWAERGYTRKLKTTIPLFLFGNIIIYLFGLFGLVRFVGLGKALLVGLYPFILGDLLKIIFAAALLPTSWRLVKNYARR